MAPGGVAAASVIVLSSHPLESGGLIDGHRRRAVLVLVGGIRVVDGSALRGETVRLGCRVVQLLSVLYIEPTEQSGDLPRKREEVSEWPPRELAAESRGVEAPE